MKKIFLTLFILLSCMELFSQTEVSLQLASAPGVYINNYTGTNIKFRRSPYGSGDVVSGLTVTHPTGNTIGNYIITGFSTWEQVRLYINDVYQEWWGTKFVGDPSTKFVDATGNVTETVDGDKTYTGIVTYSNQLNVTGAFIGTYPYINSESPLFTDYGHTNFYNSTLIWKNYADSIYGIKKWWINGFKMRLFAGYKWVGYNSSTPAIPVDNSELTYDETTGLGVGSTQDSTSFNEAVTIYYDSTDGSENNYRKSQTNYLPNYKNPIWDSLGSKGKYQRITNGSLISEQEYYNVNNAWFKELEKSSDLTTSDVIIDTLILPRPGLYQITSVFNVKFVDGSTASTDSIVVSLDDGSLPGSSRLAKQIVTFTYAFGNTMGCTMTVTVTTLFYRQGENNIVYLMGHMSNTGSSLTHKVYKTQSTAINIY